MSSGGSGPRRSLIPASAPTADEARGRRYRYEPTGVWSSEPSVPDRWTLHEQTEIVKAVRRDVEDKIIPMVTELEHADEYPQEIVGGLKGLGIFGLTIPEEYDGLGESLPTYALCSEEIARGWMSVSGVINTRRPPGDHVPPRGDGDQG